MKEYTGTFIRFQIDVKEKDQAIARFFLSTGKLNFFLMDLSATKASLATSTYKEVRRDD